MADCTRRFLHSMPIYGVAGEADDLVAGLTYDAAVRALDVVPGASCITTDRTSVEAVRQVVEGLIERQRRRCMVRAMHAVLGGGDLLAERDHCADRTR